MKYKSFVLLLTVMPMLPLSACGGETVIKTTNSLNRQARASSSNSAAVVETN